MRQKRGNLTESSPILLAATAYTEINKKAAVALGINRDRESESRKSVKKKNGSKRGGEKRNERERRGDRYEKREEERKRERE